MTEPTDIRYEAAEIIPHISGDLAILIMATDKGKIAVHMQRIVLEGLFEQLAAVLGRVVPPARPQ